MGSEKNDTFFFASLLLVITIFKIQYGENYLRNLLRKKIEKGWIVFE